MDCRRHFVTILHRVIQVARSKQMLPLMAKDNHDDVKAHKIIQSSLPDAKTSHEHQNAQGGSRHHGAREANQRLPHPLYPSTMIPPALIDRLLPRQRKMGCESATLWRNIHESDPIARLEQGGRINSGIEQANFCPPDQMPSTG